MKLLLSSEGQQVMQKNGQPAIVPAVVSDIEKIPAKLREYLES